MILAGSTLHSFTTVHVASPDEVGYDLDKFLSDSWNNGPQKDTSRETHPINKLVKYCQRRHGHDEPDLGSVSNKFTIEDPPEHPIQLMVNSFI